VTRSLRLVNIALLLRRLGSATGIPPPASPWPHCRAENPDGLWFRARCRLPGQCTAPHH